LEFCRLLHRDIPRLRAAQNLVDIVGGAPEQVREVWSIRHQTSSVDVLALTEHCWQARVLRQSNDSKSVGVYERVGTDIKYIRAGVERRLEGKRNIVGPPDFQRGDFEAERAGG